MRTKRRIYGLLAVMIAVLGLSAAIGAGSAAAAETPGEQCLLEFETGTEKFKAEGSSLQKLAQELWTGEKGSLGFDVNEEGCGTLVTGLKKAVKPLIKYNPDGSGAGLKAYGVGKANSPKGSKDIFIGTDEAPNATQLTEIDTEAKGASNKGQALVIPVAQAPVAVLINPPSGCKLKENHLTNKDLEKVFNGLTKVWSGITTAEGTCTGAIKRIVRKEGSGTTFQFKHYLFEINKEKLDCVKKTWAELQAENTTWPEDCSKEGEKIALSELLKIGEGGSGEAKEVAAKEGSVGYANLGDARGPFTGANNYTWARVENELSAQFEYPGTAAPSKTAGSANCEGAHYPALPALGADADWSAVYGGHPAENEHYPICTLTWDVALVNYELAEVANSREHAQTAYDYLNYVVAQNGGQSDFKTNDYGEVEKVVGQYAVEQARLIGKGNNVTASTKTLNFVAAPETKSVTYTNHGPAGWAPKLAIGGSGAANYKIVAGSTCTGTIAKGSTCKVEVELKAGGTKGKATLYAFEGPGVKLN